MSRTISCAGIVLCLVTTSCAESPPPKMQPRPGATVTPAPSVPPIAPSDWQAGYHAFAEFSAALRGLAETAGEAASLKSLAKTHGGREVWLLTIAAPGKVPPEERQTLLIVGGADADHPAGSETALNVARRLVMALTEEPDSGAAHMLAQRTVYIIPRLNPDGVETYFESIKRGAREDTQPIDNDRDAATDEDGPDDLNGDKLITVMRVPDPEGEWIVDPDEPRLLKKADRNMGERGIYKLVSEGIDDDGDGEINEDGPGGIDGDRNWPHLFEAGEKPAGIHQLSQPENRALAQFVVGHPRITTAVVYGRHDNTVKVPQGSERDSTGEAYRDLHPDDVKLYEHVSEQFKELTGLKESPGCRADGAFYSWIYAQRGVLTFASNVWWPLGAEDEEEEQATTQSTTQPTTQPTRSGRGERRGRSRRREERPAGGESADRPQRMDREAMMARFREEFGNRQPTQEEARAFFQRMRGGGQTESRGTPSETTRSERRMRGGRGERRFGRGEPEAAPAKPTEDALAEHVESNELNRQWLKYSDEQREHAGFVEWTAYDHPTLGKVEIGGFAPYFKTTPPTDVLDEIADKQVEFLAELSKLAAEPHFGDPEVKNLGGGVWQVEVSLVNDAYFPTHPAIALHIRAPGFAIRPQVDEERLIGGRLQQRADNVPGSGGTVSWKWLIRGSPGEAVHFRAYNRAHGEIKTTVILRDTTMAKEGE